MDELLGEFLTETSENLSVLDLELVRLEREPNNPSLLDNIFRLVHTIKGTCGFIGLPRLEKVAHSAENILGKVRDGELNIGTKEVSLILQSLDRIKSILAVLESTGAEPEGNDAELIAELDAAARGDGDAAPSHIDDAEANEALFAAVEPVSVATPDIEEPAPPVQAAPVEQTIAAAKPNIPNPIEETKAVTPAKAAKTETAKAEGADSDNAPREGGAVAVQQSIRVNVDLLENLMTTVSELVLTRNQLLQILRTQKDSPFSAPLQRLNQVVSELQEGVMKTRMQPIGSAWSKLPRIIRDLSHELNKKIELEMRGQETELDRQVLELIKDPLTHMVRNSADHGIEKPAERLKAGKSETGHVMLNAFHEGGYIIIEISDDGKGLALERIKQKALSNGLVSEQELASLTSQQIQQFIFKAGFSTAEAITSVSGRGVGMDVVKTNIEKIGGTIELHSIEGQGSTFTIKIPLTLAIVSALIVECAGERFAMPQLSVIELVRASSSGDNPVERIKGTPFLRLRDRLLPLVSLRGILNLDDDRPLDRRENFVVVTQVGAYIFGILVDRVFDTEEIVVKPVAPVLRSIDMFSGNTILGDGTVIMILDPNGIAQAAGDIRSGAGARGTDASQSSAGISQTEETSTLLVFRSGNDAPKAVPLSLVSRLEDFDPKDIELSNNKPVIQYRGKLMPLIPFGEIKPWNERVTQSALVFADKERAMGLLVDEIVDIVEEKMHVELDVDQPGMLGSTIIAGKATDLIDAGYFLTLAFPDWFGAAGNTRVAGEDKTPKKILLVDDSPFFRNLLTPLLSVAGYQVTTVESGNEALEICQSGKSFDLILSDIEMPGMNGFELAEALRSTRDYEHTPMVALSAHATQKDLDRGKASGFSDYVAKFDRAGLLQTLSTRLLDVHSNPSNTRGAA